MAKLHGSKWGSKLSTTSSALGQARGLTCLDLLASGDGALQDQYGVSIDISADGNTIVVGRRTGTSTNDAVYVWVYAAGAWSQEAKLQGDLTTGSGIAVAISDDGDTLAFTNANEGPGLGPFGYVYVYTRSAGTWSLEQKFRTTDVGTYINLSFGQKLAISGDGDTLAVGGPFAAGASGDSFTRYGSVWIFTRSAGVWSQQQRLDGSIGGSGVSENFGASVSLTTDGDRVAVGGGQITVSSAGDGAAYIWSRSAGVWSQDQQLTPDDASGGDNFGKSVAIDSTGTRVAIGAFLWNTDAVHSGKVYVFHLDGTWTQEAGVVANEDTGNFGNAVAMNGDGDKVMVGWFLKRTALSNHLPGQAAIFTRDGTTWTMTDKLASALAPNNGRFGFAVALTDDGAHYAIGEAGRTSSPFSAGQAYTDCRGGA